MVDTIQETVEALQAPDTFSFMDVISGEGRGYPKDEVKIYLDEASAYRIQKIHGVIDTLDNTSAEHKKLSAELAELKAKVKASEYTFKLTGIPTEMNEILLKKARADMPVTYDHNKNFLTGGVEKVEQDSPERDRYYTNLLYQAHVEQIVSPTGLVDTAPSVETVDAFRTKAPGSQVNKFSQAVAGLQVSATAFEDATDEDFLAKS